MQVEDMCKNLHDAPRDPRLPPPPTTRPAPHSPLRPAPPRPAGPRPLPLGRPWVARPCEEAAQSPDEPAGSQTPFPGSWLRGTSCAAERGGSLRGLWEGSSSSSLSPDRPPPEAARHRERQLRALRLRPPPPVRARAGERPAAVWSGGRRVAA